MRVISGKYKGRRFSPPRNFPSRPTTDFAKSALFNILNNQFDFETCKVLDLFSGTGSIALECISRGALNVTSVDNHTVSVKFLNKMRAELNEKNWHIHKGDAFEFLKHESNKYDIIFADPPFAMQGQQLIAAMVFEKQLLNPDGLLIIEHGRENSFENITQFKEMRNYGGVQFSFFEST
ncbi:MAG: 16S rRNA (guanine(966)-N(2))-methyltransferase RsmD [Crocinitomicaceae bacterium]|nr:16S rRNA (guanine(966)-N(2))-methyltransferase RsmD [Crocinitomicaceae bacterium]MBK8925289.1 16S rRNA (guanine(966)-N(2))-methyltransferase RsmD [Crocinitomicaceae bacterium]